MSSPEHDDRAIAAALRASAGQSDAPSRARCEALARECDGPACRVELAQLDVVRGEALEEAAATCEEVVRSRESPLELRARALHVLGQARGKLREPAGAIDALRLALDSWRELDDEGAMAQVEDSLGSVFFSIGRFDLALASYSTSLASKAVRGDRAGLALTLGNIGRVHLRAGRLDDALRCFERDLALCAELGDARGRARVLEDLGRVHLALGNLDAAESALRASLALAEELPLPSLASFAHKDLALVALRRGALDAAEPHVERAAHFASEPYAQALVADVRARLALARQDHDALERLEEVARRFADLDVPDDEIATRGEAIRAACALGLRARAAMHFDRAVALSSRDGYARWSRTLRELALELELARGPADEVGRLAARDVSDRERGAATQGDGEVEGGGSASAPRDRDGAADADRRRARDLPAGSREREDAPRASSAREDWSTAQSAAHTEPASSGYVLLRRLGRGGFGEVFETYDSERKRVVALKRLRLEDLFDVRRRRAITASMRAELEATRRIDHPLVARVHAIGKDDAGATYVVQDLVRGRSLREHLASGGSARALRTLARIADALAALHDADVLHRDLKPENIVVRASDGLPVLVDFGIAHVGGSELDATAFAGTHAYMAPERFEHGGGGAASDVFSLGTIAREWLLGLDPRRRPGTAFVAFADETPLHLRASSGAAATSPAHDPSAIEALVARLTHRAAEVRPSARAAAELFDALADAADHEDG